jgi:hypothetical protein
VVVIGEKLGNLYLLFDGVLAGNQYGSCDWPSPQFFSAFLCLPAIAEMVPKIFKLLMQVFCTTLQI